MANPELGAPTVVLIDDHELSRKALGVMLRERGINVVGEAESGGAARQLLEALRPDVVVTDAQLPDVDGVELTREIVESDVSTRVVVLGPASSEENRVDVDRALAAGANAYVFRDASPNDLIEAVRVSADPPFVAYPAKDASELSERQLEFLRGRLPRVENQGIFHRMLAWRREHTRGRP